MKGTLTPRALQDAPVGPFCSGPKCREGGVMTALTFPESRLESPRKRVCDTNLLRASLAPRWAVLFSHPEDFAQEQLESDRWLSVLARSFKARGVLPVAVARPGSDPEQGWLGQLAALDGESVAVLTLDD